MRLALVRWTLPIGIGTVLLLALPYLPRLVSSVAQAAEKSDLSGSDDALADSLIKRKTWWTALNF